MTDWSKERIRPYFQDKRFFNLEETKFTCKMVGERSYFDFSSFPDYDDLFGLIDFFSFDFDFKPGVSVVSLGGAYTYGIFDGQGYAREFVEGLLDFSRGEGFSKVRINSLSRDSDSFWDYMGFSETRRGKFERQVNE